MHLAIGWALQEKSARWLASPEVRYVPCYQCQVPDEYISLARPGAEWCVATVVRCDPREDPASGTGVVVELERDGASFVTSVFADGGECVLEGYCAWSRALQLGYTTRGAAIGATGAPRRRAEDWRKGG